MEFGCAYLSTCTPMSVQCFFRDSNVISGLRKMAPVPLGMSSPRGILSSPDDVIRWPVYDVRCVRVRVVDKPAVSVGVEVVPCTRVSMDLFDPIYSSGVLTPSGHVVKCFHDVFPDYDELRQVSLYLSFLSMFQIPTPLFVFISRCCRMRTAITTTRSAEPSAASSSSASSNTCVSAASCVSMRTPSIRTSAPPSSFTKIWSGGRPWKRTYDQTRFERKPRWGNRCRPAAFRRIRKPRRSALSPQCSKSASMWANIWCLCLFD